MNNVARTVRICFPGITNEILFTRKRVDHLKDEKTLTLDKLHVVLDETIPMFWSKQATQDARLVGVKNKVV